MMNKILLIALEDGEITKDELAILEQVKLDVQNLRIEWATDEKVLNLKLV